MIPYYPVPTWTLGPVTLDMWALLVSLGFIFGLEMARARAIKHGLDIRDIVDGGVFVVGMGFVVGHIVHVVAYNPHQLEEQGVMALLKVWAGFSSYGGFIGALIAVVIFFKFIRKRPFWKNADVMMWGFPFGWMLGRFGCFAAHDHIGKHTDFFLAVDFPAHFWGNTGGPRHDLGLYEALWTTGIAIIFFALRNKAVRPGFFTALWCMLYAPARFLFDFLRNTDLGEGSSDVRWLGLTPGQYGSMLMFFAGLGVVLHLRNAVAAPAPETPPDPAPEPPAEE